MIERLRYIFYNQFSKGTKRLYVWLTILSFLPLLFLSVFLFIVPGASPFSTFLNTFYTQLLAALDPGNFLVFDLVGESDAVWDGNVIFIFTSIIATLIGLIIIATLIGIISASIEEVMLNLRKGRTKVIERGHIIILGWTDEIYSIIGELDRAHINTKKQVVVIMSQQDTIFMKDSIDEKVESTNLKIVFRKGSPLDLNDLKILSLKDAKSVIILNNNEQRDIQVLKICLAINKLTPGEFEHGFSVIVGMDSQSNMQLLKEVSRNSINPFNIHLLHTKIIAQCCRQSGLSVIYSDLLDFDGHEIYFLNEQNTVGMSFKDVLMYYKNSMVIGVKNNGNTIIQPPNDYIIKEGDKLIAIQEDDNVEERSDDIKIDVDCIEVKGSEKDIKQDILIINWNIDAPLLIKDLCEYITEDSKIDVILDSEGNFDVSNVSNQLDSLSKKVDKVIIGDVNSIEFLESQPLADYNSIVILSETVMADSDVSNKADAKTIITLLQLRSIKQKIGIQIPVISQIQNPQNKELTDQKSSDDFIVSNQLIGHYTCQLAENPELQDVFEEILKPEGSEIYLRDVVDYININSEVNFYTVMEAFVPLNQIPIGYKVFSEIYDPKHHGIHLNPDKSEYIKFTKDDKIIVLAES